MEQKKKVYISGKITGLPWDGVKLKFKQAEAELVRRGYIPMSPLNNGCDSDCWCLQMIACLNMLVQCDGIYLLSDWTDSTGAKIEHQFAVQKGLIQITQNQTDLISNDPRITIFGSRRI